MPKEKVHFVILLIYYSFILLFKVAQFNVYYTAATSLFPALMAFYLGAWADIFGRKRIIYIYSFANLIDYGGALLNVIFIEWPLIFLIPCTMSKYLVGKAFLSH